MFTDDRPRGMPAYFQHPKYRSAYLLYFLPLQAAKFLTLFELHTEALEEALATGKREGVLRVLDLGSGPATASLAALLWFSRRKDCPPIECTLVDTQASSLADGKILLEELSALCGHSKGKITVSAFTQPWWEAPRLLPEGRKASLILMGHVLNEAAGPPLSNQGADPEDNLYLRWFKTWEGIFSLSSGGGILLVDLASRKTSQLLSRLRDEWLAAKLASDVWGPCLHLGKCPLRDGRDWCHFSLPVRIPGHWFKEFSQALGSERQWLKMSYLWMAQPGAKPKTLSQNLRRVISDPLGDRKNAVLLCEPDHPSKFALKPRSRIFRGDLVQLR